MEEDVADRMVLSWDSFLSLAPWALDGTLYPAAGERVRAFSQIFPEIEAEFHLAIRNPATFLPALLEKLPNKTYAEFIGKADIFQLHWSQVVQRILDAEPRRAADDLVRRRHAADLARSVARGRRAAR